MLEVAPDRQTPTVSPAVAPAGTPGPPACRPDLPQDRLYSESNPGVCCLHFNNWPANKRQGSFVGPSANQVLGREHEGCERVPRTTWDAPAAWSASRPPARTEDRSPGGGSPEPLRRLPMKPSGDSLQGLGPPGTPDAETSLGGEHTFSPHQVWGRSRPLPPRPLIRPVANPDLSQDRRWVQQRQ